MYKTVFQNSKVALLFAGFTIFGAATLVGTPEDEGVLDRTADMFAAQRATIANEAQAYADMQSVGDVPPSNPDAGWGSSAPVFGDYASGGQGIVPTKSGSGSSQVLPTGTIIPGPQPVVADNEGIPVPGPEDDDGQRSGPPVITAREMTIQPH